MEVVEGVPEDAIASSSVYHRRGTICELATRPLYCRTDWSPMSRTGWFAARGEAFGSSPI